MRNWPAVSHEVQQYGNQSWPLCSPDKCQWKVQAERSRWLNKNVWMHSWIQMLKNIVFKIVYVLANVQHPEWIAVSRQWTMPRILQIIKQLLHIHHKRPAIQWPGFIVQITPQVRLEQRNLLPGTDVRQPMEELGTVSVLVWWSSECVLPIPRPRTVERSIHPLQKSRWDLTPLSSWRCQKEDLPRMGKLHGRCAAPWGLQRRLPTIQALGCHAKHREEQGCGRMFQLYLTHKKEGTEDICKAGEVEAIQENRKTKSRLLY